jgi:hypothetical protein
MEVDAAVTTKMGVTVEVAAPRTGIAARVSINFKSHNPKSHSGVYLGGGCCDPGWVISI